MDNLLRWAGLTVLATLLVACSNARPVGDFGRAAPSYTHDVSMPATGERNARNRKEPVSDFNLTDQETEMHDRVWRFLVAAHARDWQFDTAAELQRTRISPPRDGAFTIERYYAWLQGAAYRSSRTRYASVGQHITADIETLPATFAAICAVIEIDRQRAIAYGGLRSGLPPATADNLAARQYENDAFIAWFVRALNYRYQSYDYALDSLLVETPHEQSRAVDESLRLLSSFVSRANRRDFCTNSGANRRGTGLVIPSRYQREGDTEIVLPK